MAKPKTVFTCQNCGEKHPRWQGQCSNCSEWNTLVESIEAVPVKRGIGVPAEKAYDSSNVIAFSEVDLAGAQKRRISTTIGEFDRVLGSGRLSDGSLTTGMVPGAVMLIGGEPGIGKSTLLTQMVVQLIFRATEVNPNADKPLLYVSGEESPSQISLRIKRILELEQKNTSTKKQTELPGIPENRLLFVTTTDVDEITTIIKEKQPGLVIIDSIQTLQTTDLTGAEGSVGQLRESTQRITDTVKRLHIPTFLVGHVTKEGTIAGPKVLEHIVDSVLELTGERTGQLRLLRAIKNRFGATDEVGVFSVNEYGLAEVPNPSALFLEEAQAATPGSAVACVMEGTRPLLIEVQALVVNSQLAMPRRVGRGIELNRIQVLSAVLQKHARLQLGNTDIFVSAAGGFNIREPSVDLSLAVAIASSMNDTALPEKTVFIGEVGLLGEVRNVSHLDQRIKEAKRLGFTKIISRKSHTQVREVLKDLKLL
ncbi:MAG: DNA repair protein RadA [bacterium]|nr:DNA repair protein RadA [bacterium]